MRVATMQFWGPAGPIKVGGREDREMYVTPTRDKATGELRTRVAHHRTNQHKKAR